MVDSTGNLQSQQAFHVCNGQCSPLPEGSSCNRSFSLKTQLAMHIAGNCYLCGHEYSSPDPQKRRAINSAAFSRGQHEAGHERDAPVFPHDYRCVRQDWAGTSSSLVNRGGCGALFRRRGQFLNHIEKKLCPCSPDDSLQQWSPLMESSAATSLHTTVSENEDKAPQRHLFQQNSVQSRFHFADSAHTHAKQPEDESQVNASLSKPSGELLLREAPGLFTCLCGDIFQSEELLVGHFTQEKPEEYQCSGCLSKFPDYNETQNHVLTCVNQDGSGARSEECVHGPALNLKGRADTHYPEGLYSSTTFSEAAPSTLSYLPAETTSTWQEIAFSHVRSLEPESSASGVVQRDLDPGGTGRIEATHQAIAFNWICRGECPHGGGACQRWFTLPNQLNMHKNGRCYLCGAQYPKMTQDIPETTRLETVRQIKAHESLHVATIPHGPAGPLLEDYKPPYLCCAGIQSQGCRALFWIKDELRKHVENDLCPRRFFTETLSTSSRFNAEDREFQPDSVLTRHGQLDETSEARRTFREPAAVRVNIHDDTIASNECYLPRQQSTILVPQAASYNYSSTATSKASTRSACLGNPSSNGHFECPQAMRNQCKNSFKFTRVNSHVESHNAINMRTNLKGSAAPMMK
ncbi:hypothetical protein NliqN6_4548 [Naganishia liquefaciens]|uniref:Uncharacterized protein n=1 Tax=Naganishia liquefaciens TaxID=104408 RepID=A0A8H3TWF5_9TREE|nr:hypothetical protein NliqN6_4548 [Naganishia liquefaciens]